MPAEIKDTFTKIDDDAIKFIQFPGGNSPILFNSKADAVLFMRQVEEGKAKGLVLLRCTEGEGVDGSFAIGSFTRSVHRSLIWPN